jgi:hypothetical protein
MLNKPLTLICTVLLLGMSLSSSLNAAEVADDLTTAIEAIDDIEITLQGIAAAFTPARSEPGMMMAKAEARGSTLRLTYHVDADAHFFRANVRYSRLIIHCGADEPSRALIDAGATLEDLYVSADGDELMLVTVDQAVCDAGPSVQDVQDVLQDLAIIPPAAENLVTVVAQKVIGSTLRSTIHYTGEDPFPQVLVYIYYTQKICLSSLHRALAEDGATFEYLFLHPDGEALGGFAIKQADCEAFSKALAHER